MKKLKLIFIFIYLIFLSGCIQTTALIGPGITVATSGNIIQAGLQYSANTAIKNETGKYPLAHIKERVKEQNNHKRFEVRLINFIEERIEATKKKLYLN